jgi:hypothetical protein
MCQDSLPFAIGDRKSLLRRGLSANGFLEFQRRISRAHQVGRQFDRTGGIRLVFSWQSQVGRLCHVQRQSLKRNGPFGSSRSGATERLPNGSSFISSRQQVQDRPRERVPSTCRPLAESALRLRTSATNPCSRD